MHWRAKLHHEDEVVVVIQAEYPPSTERCTPKPHGKSVEDRRLQANMHGHSWSTQTKHFFVQEQ